MDHLASASVDTRSIAVLPFVNMSTDPENEYFSDGITEEIINVLTRIPGLKVIARTSSFAFKGKNEDVRSIGEQLKVASILEGSVRKSQQQLRITAQLIETRSGTHLWSHNFDRQLQDIFALQDEVSLLIAEKVRENFGHFNIQNESQPPPTTNIEAYELYLQASYYFKRKDYQDIQRAAQLFEKAIALAPDYAAAHAFLAETYLHLGGFGILSPQESQQKAAASARQALELRNDEMRAHKVMAYLYLFYDWNWTAAQAAYEQAVTHGLTADNELATYFYLFLENQPGKAIEIAQQTLLTDPLHAMSHWQLGLTYYFSSDFTSAIKAFNGALTLDADFGEALRWRGICEAHLGQFQVAQVSIERALAVAGGEGPATYDLLQLQALRGEEEAVISAIQTRDFPDATDPAMLYSLMGQAEPAIDYLETAYEQHSVMLTTLQHFWLWDPIREHPRFKALQQKMQFPAPLPGPPTSPAPASVTKRLLTAEEVAHYLERLSAVMEEQQLALDPQLSLRGLAEIIDLHPNKLSWLLNEELDQNFNEYINYFRLSNFKIKALDPVNSHLTLLALAFESGFNSKTVFNEFFKKKEGMTPRAWLKTQAQ